MKRTLMATLVASLLATTAVSAETIGVSIALLEHNFLAVMTNGMIGYADKRDDVTLQIEDAQNDVAKQLNQIQNFIASGVDAIIVNAVDTSATQAMSDIAEKAGIPLVYVNRQPVNLENLPKGQAFVASNEVDSGTLETVAVCDSLKKQGKGDGANIVVMVGELANQAAVQRTQDVHDVIATPACSFMKIVEEQTANWNRVQGQDLMTNWMSAGVEFDAVVANNDEMAIGAIQALKAGGISMDDIIVAGVDATQDALIAMQQGDLDITIFQDAYGQGEGSIDIAVKLVRGEMVETKVYIPFLLVTPENIGDFLDKN